MSPLRCTWRACDSNCVYRTRMHVRCTQLWRSAWRLAVVTEGLRKRYGADRGARRRWTWRSRRARSAACSARTAPARRRRCGSSPRCCAPTAGAPRSPGFDVAREAAQVRSRIGLTVQHDAVDEVLTGRQNLVMFGAPVPPRPRAARGAARTSCSSSSGSPRRPAARRRLLGRDAPPAGPRGRASSSRRRCCSSTSRPPARTRATATRCGTSCAGSSRDGTTVLLTTHYLDEADQLADQISRDRPRPRDRRRHAGRSSRRASAAARSTSSCARPTSSPRRRRAARARGRRRAGARPPTAPRVSAPVRDRVAALADAARARSRRAGDRGRGRRAAPPDARRGVPAAHRDAAAPRRWRHEPALGARRRLDRSRGATSRTGCCEPVADRRRRCSSRSSSSLLFGYVFGSGDDGAGGRRLHRVPDPRAVRARRWPSASAETVTAVTVRRGERRHGPLPLDADGAVGGRRRAAAWPTWSTRVLGLVVMLVVRRSRSAGGGTTGSAARWPRSALLLLLRFAFLWVGHLPRAARSARRRASRRCRACCSRSRCSRARSSRPS